jgi:hypothetical protein
MSEPGQLEIELQLGDDVSPLEVDQLTAAMRRELLQLDVEGVDRVSSGPPPAGAKGVELAAIGALIVSLGGVATPILAQVVEAVRAWTARGPDRTVKLTLDGDILELGGMSEQDQHKVISDWMARHPRPAAP